MRKDAYYFSHDANAQDDPKCIMLIDQLGMEGYGIFWGLVELLRCEKDYRLPLAIIPALATRWKSSKEKITAVVSGFDLFEVENNKFFSMRLLRSMQDYTEKKLRLSEAGRKGGLSHAKAMLKPPFSIKEKEIKEKESISDSDRRKIIGEWLEQFWAAYPKKVKKGLVEQIFFDIFLNLQNMEQMVEMQKTIMNAIENQKPHWKEKEPEYIPGPDKWLQDERWKDEIIKPTLKKEMFPV